MWELICHHTYKWGGRPVDISPYDNPAEASHSWFLPDGATPGSGALRFTSPMSHVRVYSGRAWNRLGAIQVQLTVRLTEPSTGLQTLIEGDASFGVFVKGEILFGYFRGKSIYPGMNSDGLNTYQDGMDFPGYRVPFGEWVVITFVHDGMSQMRLYVDGIPVTVARSVLAGVPPIGPRGTCIGNGLDGHAPFGGDIDEVKVWRLDPYTNIKKFLSRPADKATIACWEQLSASLLAELTKHPDCAMKIDSDFWAVLDRLTREILAKGPETHERFRKFQEEFDRLWRAGRLNGRAMKTLLRDWLAWLRLVGVDLALDPDLNALKNSVCLKLIMAELKNIDCDREYRRMSRNVDSTHSPSFAA